MAATANVNVGDFVEVIVKVWTEDENPTIKNFYQGKITEVVERSVNCFYVKIDGLDRLIPVDRVIA